MNGGRFFNTVGLDQNGPEPQPNSFNNQGNFVGASSMSSNPQQSNLMNQGMYGNSQPQMMGNPMQQGNLMDMNNPMSMGNPMNNSNPMMHSSSSQVNPMMQNDPMVNNNPMNMGNPMNNGNQMMQNGSMMSNNQLNNGGSVSMTNPMNNVETVNVMPQQGTLMNQELAAQQSFSPMYQDPNPSIPQMHSNMNQPQPNPMVNFPTGANQGPIGAQTNPMSMGNPMNNNPINNSQSASSPANIGNPMMDNVAMNQNNQQTIMMNSDTPSFNNSLNGISPLEPMPTAVDTGKNIKMKSKLNLDFKKILIIGVVLLVAIMVVLSLLCYKNVTCTGNEEVYGAKVEVVVKSYFWFGKINKIVTTKTVDLSPLNENDREYIVGLYKDKEDNSSEKIEVKDDKIVITVTVKPGDSDEANITADELIESYEKYNFTCK